MEPKLLKELHKKFNIRPLPSTEEMFKTLKSEERLRPMTARTRERNVISSTACRISGEDYHINNLTSR